MRKNFCAICWRPVNDVIKADGRKQYFCWQHKASGETRNAHLRGKRRLLSALEARGVKLDNNLDRSRYYRILSTCVMEFVIDPARAYEDGAKNLKSAPESVWYFVKYIASRFYPITYKKLAGANFDRPYSKEVFIRFLMDVLEGRNRKAILPVSFVGHVSDLEPASWFGLVFEVIARHEFYMSINEKKSRPGPDKGAGKDVLFRARIKNRLSELAALGENISQKKLADEFGVSKQRMSVLFREVKG